MAPTVPSGLTTSNWSGYIYGGTFTGIAGTFTVPYLTTAANCNEGLANWVGIDGYTNTDLIQAGVEDTEVNGVCTPGFFYTSPWWEILPAPETPQYQVAVYAGDSVSVVIEQVSPGLWSIQLTDNTDSQSFEVEEAYNGPGATAEWITEAPTIGGVIVPIAPYTPAVQFSDLDAGGTPTISGAAGMVPITLIQNGVIVSTPSAFTAANGGSFTDTYTG